MTQVIGLMVIFLLIIIIIIAIYMGYRVYVNYKTKDHDILDERIILENINDQAVTFGQSKYKNTIQNIEVEEQRLFDDVVTLFMSKKIYVSAISQATQIQEDVLRKMPLKTKAYIQRNEQEYWSIYWMLSEQSLEYYVSQYGVFVTHVDRYGTEHKETYLNHENRGNIFDRSLNK